MDATTGEVAGASVQIGDPVVEKLLIDVLTGAEDLYSAITDCGAGGLSSADSQSIEDLLKHWRLPLVLDPTIEKDALVGHMSRDKKFSAGRKRFVLLTAAGEAMVSEEITDELVDRALDHVRMPA